MNRIHHEETHLQHRERRAAIRAKKPNADWQDLTNFACTLPGEIIMSGMTGTCSELHWAGSCVACLGSGDDTSEQLKTSRKKDNGSFSYHPVCPHCGGSGDASRDGS